jgi:DNA-binding MarR family transcriptional regulator
MTEADKARKLLHVIDAFRRLDPKLPVRWVFAFLYVAANEGCAVSDVARALGLALPPTTTMLNALSAPRHRLLVRVRTQSDGRERRLVLSPRGKALMRSLRLCLEGA